MRAYSFSAAASSVGRAQAEPVIWSGAVFCDAAVSGTYYHLRAITHGQETFGGGGVLGKRIRAATPKETHRFAYACAYDPSDRLWLMTSRANDSAPWPQYLCHFSAATLKAAANGARVTPDIQVILPSSSAGYLCLAFDAAGNAWVGPTTDYTIARIDAANLVTGTISAFDVGIAIKDGVANNPNDLCFADNGDVYIAGHLNGSGCGIAWLQAAQIASSTPTSATSTLIPYKQIGMRGTANKRGYTGVTFDPTGGGVWTTGFQVAGGNGPAIYRYGFDKFDGNGTDSPPAGCHDPAPDASLTCATSGAFDSPMCPRFDSQARLHWSNRWVSGQGVVSSTRLHWGGRLLHSDNFHDGAAAVTPDRLFGNSLTPGGIYAFVP